MIGAEDLELLKPELVFVDIDAEDTEDLFRQMQVRLDSMGYIKDNWLDAMLERERNYATGLQTPTIGVAIPHADNCVNKAYIAVIKPVKPVTFQPMGGIGDEVEAELVINLGIMREGGAGRDAAGPDAHLYGRCCRCRHYGAEYPRGSRCND